MPKGAAGSQQGRNVIIMSNRGIGASPALRMRVTDLNERMMRGITENELKGIWVPDAVHEAVRDLVRVRSAASEDVRKKRQMLLSFLLRHGRVFTGRKNWTRAHARWLAAQKFDHPAQQIVFQDQVNVITDAQERLERLDAQ